MFSFFFFFSSRRRHTRWPRDWSSDVCSSDLGTLPRSARDAVSHASAPVRDHSPDGSAAADPRRVRIHLLLHYAPAQRLEQQERLLLQARLDALTSQINPHFLFNTLNSVSSLIRTNPEQARSVVQRLARIMRRRLRTQDHFVALREELDFVEDYLSIELVRFGDKLRVIKDLDSATLDMLVPSMLLQPLIENSIKHGISGKIE